MSRGEIEAFAPQPGDYVLITKLRDGSSVVFAERYILPRLQACIDKLEEEGVQMILFLCTGEFPTVFHSRVPLIFPCKILNGLVPALAGREKIAVVAPTQEQVAQTEQPPMSRRSLSCRPLPMVPRRNWSGQRSRSRRWMWIWSSWIVSATP